MRRGRNYEPIGLAHIGTLLAEAIGDEERVQQALGVWPAWEQAVGPQIAAAARPVALKAGVLTIHVKHSVWLQELTAQKATLLRRVRATASGSVVRELRFRLGELPLAQKKPVAAPIAAPPPAPIPFELARAIRGVPSPELRTLLLRVASKWSAQSSAQPPREKGPR